MAGNSRNDVRETYDRIASHFAVTREYPWPEVQSFIETASTGGVGLDLGCGNCRHADVLSKRVTRVLGVDLSRELLELGRERAIRRKFDVDLLQADASTLPVASDAVDLGVYVATLHHLPTRTDRVASLSELARVLADEGQALVGVWSTEHDRFDETDGFDTTIEWTLPDGETVDRFYHIYSPDEFGAELTDSALDTIDRFVSSGNCYAVVEAEA